MEKILDLIERDFYTISKDEKHPGNEQWIFLVTVKIEWHFPNKKKKNHTGLLNSFITVITSISVNCNI